MAKQVEGISEKVELCAKKEFLEKGYVDASLRTIAAEAGTTTGTIYSRYGGKEGLFSAIVEPVAKEFTGIFIGVQEKFHAIESDRQAVSLDDYAEDGMKQLVKYMYAHLEEFQILVKSSYGTRFQDFVEHLVELETDYTYKFMHIMNKALFESFFEVIRHDMSEEEAWEYIEMLEKYHSAGWNIIYGECCSIND